MRCMVQSPGPASRHSVAPGEMFPGWHTSGLEGFEMVPSHRSYAVIGDSTLTSCARNARNTSPATVNVMNAPTAIAPAFRVERQSSRANGTSSTIGLSATENPMSRPPTHGRRVRTCRKPSAATPRAMSSSCFHQVADATGAKPTQPSTRSHANHSRVRSRVHVQIATAPPTMASTLANVTHHAAVWRGVSRVIGANSIATNGDPTQPVIAYGSPLRQAAPPPW